ncbi:hypothetical protein F4677DRAFT_5152 [Hypoxylon crocopeplum]|nr:hypothetical protein F4677DRAFT_5152 [Hypoxylon crocopeplum]
MASNKRSPTPEYHTLEDPDTAAARKELRETVISDKPNLPTSITSTTSTMSTAHASTAPHAIASVDKASTKGSTPDRESIEPRNDELRDQVSSPKKKRAHDEVDEPREAPTNGDVSPIGADSGTSIRRTDRSEPEKKRPRDVSSESQANSNTPTTSSEAMPTSKTTEKGDQAKAGSEKNKEAPPTSAFATSSLAGFASQPSPFLQASAKPLSSFASPSGAKSLFATAAQSPFATAAPTSTASVFGSSSLSNGASPFGQVGGAPKAFGTSTFGGTFGSTFGSKTGASTLSTFGKPGESFKSNKPARPFGAPVSEEEDNGVGEDEDSEDEGGANNEDSEAQEERPDKSDKTVAVDDKKKPKLQLTVDDGEAGEATILQVRAKIYHLDKASSSWKERGAGNLKINVPHSCVEYDEYGVPIPGSFDASLLEEAESKVVRLIMRQDSTHRVILNTAIIPAMEFQEKSTVKATCVLFTAIEGEGAVSIQLKMNVTNATTFLNEVTKVQRELQSV